ncbi:uncharacterized protein YbjT (DUF2867 family) [Martelella mangrovi]|uniref:Uncharacterized protein YbjT (DUF2867 family) n=2 Tax=Martelella mangrovi TaxID=1397477 RepID=A0ABV2IGP7_9HYPH
MEGVQSVFSVQPSSGAAGSGITDAQKVLYGKAIVDLAVQAGVQHIVYSSADLISEGPTGLPNLDTKLDIEDCVRRSGVASTILRPATFMELLTLPGIGLNEGRITFFLHPEQSMQVSASEDIGKIAAAVLCWSACYAGQTISIAGDDLTGLHQIQDALTVVTGQPVTYHRFPDALLAENEFLARNAALFDRLQGARGADIAVLNDEFGALMTLRGVARRPRTAPSPICASGQPARCRA